MNKSDDNPTNTMVCIGAVCVMAEQIGGEDPTRLAINPDPFLLRLFASQQVLTESGEEAVKAVGFKYIGSSKWAARIVAMKDGDKALLPSEQGYYCVVRRYADEAALGICDFIPDFTMDWT